MPELPELEVVCEVLQRKLAGCTIRSVSVAPRGGPIVIRDLTHAGFAEGLVGRHLAGFSRRGKFIRFSLKPDDLTLVVNPKLSGRFQLCEPKAKRAGPVHVVLAMDPPDLELRYVDDKRMGQLYLTPDVHLIPTFDQMGPEATEIDLQEFKTRLRRYRGEVKGILTRSAFVAGIGNAYADEILWQAKLHPYRKRPTLDEAEIERLHASIGEVLSQAVLKVRKEMGEDIHLKPRAFFNVHMRGGQPCPRCGTTISSVTAHQKITNFCRTCQPGGLIQGMAVAKPARK